MAKLTDTRLWSLTRKEFHLLRRNKRLMVQLTLPPTIFVLLMGYALNPDVRGLRLGVADLSQTPASRDLIYAVTRNESFEVTGYYPSAEAVGAAIDLRRLDLGLVIPPDYDRLLERRAGAPVQILIDAINANTGGIVAGYLSQIFADYNSRALGPAPPGLVKVTASVAVFYNPGLKTSWFVVTGVMSMLLIINGTLVASGLVVREKELGTVEQLLMTPAETLEILLAKTFPILVLLVLDLLISLEISRLAFDVPMRGSPLLLVVVAVMAAFSGIGIGILIATVSSTQQQSQLLAFFIIPPLITLSGAVTPMDSMPAALQQASYVNPLRYLALSVRGIVLKGAGISELWFPLLALLGFAVLIYGWSAVRFRKQMG